MRRGRIFIFLALVLIIGLAVVVFVFRQFFIQGPQTAESQLTSTVEVYIAGQNIPLGEPITEEALTTITIPQENAVSVMFTTDQRGDLVGKTAKYPIEQGVMITRTMISGGAVAASGPQWASQIPQGMTAISIPTSRLESVAYGVQDGAHVDVSACFLFVDVDPSYQTELPNKVGILTSAQSITTEIQQGQGLTLGVTIGEAPQGRTEVESAFQQGIYVVPSEEHQRPRLVCQMVLQNVIVLKLGNFSLQQAQTTTPEQTDPEAQAPAQVILDVVTLIVAPQDSVTLSYLVLSGAKITMTLRNALDESRVATEAATLQFLLSQYNIPVPAKLPYAMNPIESQDLLSTPPPAAE